MNVPAVSEATRSDLPRGAEAQCPICWRIFTRDGNCERHKRYKTADCVDPATVGLVWTERRGLRIWHSPGSGPGGWVPESQDSPNRTDLRPSVGSERG